MNLPELITSELDRDQMQALFADLHEGAQITDVQLRLTTRGTPERCDLRVAETAFMEGRATAVQVRYRFDNDDWCDTLTTRGAITRLVRMKGMPVADSA